MAGRPGRNRAWNKLPLEHHLKSGTYRADRHGPIPPTVSPWAGLLPTGQAATPDRLPPWAPSPEDLESLQPAGRAFVAKIFATVTIDDIQGRLVLEAARALDSLTAWQIEASSNPRAARLAIQFAKLHASLIKQAGLR